MFWAASRAHSQSLSTAPSEKDTRRTPSRSSTAENIRTHEQLRRLANPSALGGVGPVHGPSPRLTRPGPLGGVFRIPPGSTPLRGRPRSGGATAAVRRQSALLRPGPYPSRPLAPPCRASGDRHAPVAADPAADSRSEGRGQEPTPTFGDLRRTAVSAPTLLSFRYPSGNAMAGRHVMHQAPRRRLQRRQCGFRSALAGWAYAAPCKARERTQWDVPRRSDRPDSWTVRRDQAHGHR